MILPSEMKLLLSSVLLCCLTYASILDVDKFGTVKDNQTVEAAFANRNAFYAAFAALATAESGSTLMIPDSVYYSMPVDAVAGLSNKKIEINGQIIASNNISEWPVASDEGNVKYQNFWQFNNCTNLTITSNKTGFDYENRGLINGNGWDWWTLFAFNKLEYKRPHLFVTLNCTNLKVLNIRLIDSPNFHFSLLDTRNLLVENVIVWVNISKQASILKLADKIINNRTIENYKTLDARVELGKVRMQRYWNFELDVPMFPFNTDGIDVAGMDLTVRNCSISNYDDSVCIKPSKLTTFGCSKNILIEDCSQIVGAGMSVGSVPPNDDINCVENVVFRNIYFYNPLKAVYVKTNSGEDGYGRVENVSYINMTIRGAPVIWPIDLGPQQQKEPNGGGDGCFLDFVKCEANPRVNMTNIHLYNVSVDEPITNPGIISCNETNPCTGFIFSNVSFIGDDILPYVCENVYGKAVDSNPDPYCFRESSI